MRSESLNLAQTLLGLDMRFEGGIWGGCEIFDRCGIPAFPDNCVQFRAEDENRARDVEEKQEDQHATKRTVGATRISNRQIKAKPCCGKEPEEGRQHRSGGNP